MTESLINEWLTDCADFTSLELHTFANTLAQDNEIVRALYNLLEERSKYSEVFILRTLWILYFLKTLSQAWIQCLVFENGCSAINCICVLFDALKALENVVVSEYE